MITKIREYIKNIKKKIQSLFKKDWKKDSFRNTIILS